MNYLKTISQTWWFNVVVFYNKLSWFVCELPEKDISNVVVQCRKYSTKSCRGLCRGLERSMCMLFYTRKFSVLTVDRISD